jgi:hypothetical protein
MISQPEGLRERLSTKGEIHSARCLFEVLCAHFYPIYISHYEFVGILSFKKVPAMGDLFALVPASKSTWLFAVIGVTLLAFAISAFSCDRLGYKIISPFLAAGAWLSAAFGVLVWLWR